MPEPNLRHDFPFDPTYGYDLDQLRSVGIPPEPADFSGFWQLTYEHSRQVDLNLTSREIPCPHEDYQLFEVAFDSLDGVRIGAWLTRPRVPSPSCGGWVVGHGYGGRSGPEYELPGPAAPAIFPCARGFDLSRHPEIPGEASAHVLHGIAHRETYSHRGSTADLWGAASALLALCPEAKSNLRYYGGSFGGGIGALALPWDDRFRSGFLDIPSFGNHPLRVQLPCVGSGEAVRQYLLQHPKIMDVLAYFDAAIAARQIKIPIFVAAATFDPAVPPPGQFAIYNALTTEKDLFVRTAAHFPSRYEVTENRSLRPLLAQWFARHAA